MTSDENAQQRRHLHIQLLGPFRVWRDGNLIQADQWRTHHHQTLFQRLISEQGRFLNTDELIEAAWPEADPGEADAHLRKRIGELRRLLEPGLDRGQNSAFILTCPGGYCFNRDANYVLDLDEFDTHVKLGNEQEEQRNWINAIRLYKAAACWYGGDFLEEEPYEDWIELKRLHWQTMYLNTLNRLASCHARLGEYERAIKVLEQALARRDDWVSGYLQLMVYHDRIGQTAEALHVYERCRVALEEVRSLQVPDEIQRLYRQLSQGDHVEEIDDRTTTYPSVRDQPSQVQSDSPWVDREAELGRLETWLEEAASGKPRVVVISGTMGIGKSRLAQEARQMAALRGSLTLSAPCTPSDASGLPFEPLVRALRQLASHLTRGDIAGLGSPWLEQVVQLIPELGNVVPRLQSPSSLPTEREVERQQESLIRLVLTLARSRNHAAPLHILIDDLQQVSHRMMNLIGSLLSRGADHPMMILLAVRSEAVSVGSELATWLDKLVNASNEVREIHLSRLDRRHTEELANQLAPDLPRAKRSSVARQSDGHPLYLMMSLQASQASEEQEGASMSEVVTKVLDSLPREEHQLLRLASTAGVRFNFAVLAEAAGRADKHLDELLTQLIDRRLIQVESHDQLAFSHAFIQQAIYESLGNDRPSLHRLVAQAMERHRDRLATRQVNHVLAWQWAKAEAWERTLRYARRAAADAVSSFHNDTGLEVIQLGLQAIDELRASDENGPLWTAWFDLLVHQATLLDRLGRRDAQEDVLNQLDNLLTHLNGPERHATVWELRVHWARTLDRYDEAESYAQSLLAIRQEKGDAESIGRALIELGRIHWERGDVQSAETRYREALDRLQTVDSPAQTAAAFNNLGIIQRSCGNHEASLAYLGEALNVRQRAGQLLYLAQTKANIGNVHWAMGRATQALAHYQAADEIFRSLGDRRSEALIANSIGIAYDDLGQYEESLRWYERAGRIFREIDDAKSEGEVFNNVGRIYAVCGCFDDALEHLERARDIVDKVGDRRALALVESTFGNLYLRWARPEQAVPYFESAYRLRWRQGDTRRQGLNLNGLGRTMLDLGDLRRAERYLERALAHFRKLELPHLEADALAHLSLVELERESHDGALAHSRLAVSLLETAESEGVEHPEEIHFARFRVLQRVSHDEAHEALENAHQAIMERASQMADLELREAYLFNVPLNAKILRVRG